MEEDEDHMSCTSNIIQIISFKEMLESFISISEIQKQRRITLNIKADFIHCAFTEAPVLHAVCGVSRCADLWRWSCPLS